MTDQKPFGAFAPGLFARRSIAMTRAMPDNWAGKRLAFALRNLAMRALGGRPVDVEMFGAKLRLHPYHNVCEKRVLFTPQYFDPKERELLGRAIHDRFVFVDVGANVGAYALFVAAKAGPGARILAVEPQPRIFDRLTANIRFNPFGSVKAVDYALADKSGEVTLFLDPVNEGESSVKYMSHGNGSGIRVPATTLHELLAEHGFSHVDAVKVDVGGAEDLILEPFLRSAPDSLLPRLVMLEAGDGRWQVDLPSLLHEKGYRQLMRTKLNAVYERA